MCDEDTPFNLENKFLEELEKLEIIKLNVDKKDKDKDISKQKDIDLIDNINDNQNDNTIVNKYLDE